MVNGVQCPQFHPNMKIPVLELEYEYDKKYLCQSKVTELKKVKKEKGIYLCQS